MPRAATHPPSASTPGRLRPAWLGVLLLLTLAAHVCYRLSTNAADPDLWGLMSFGRLWLEGGAFPWRDPFAYTPTRVPWVYHEWLSGTLFYLLWRTGGPAALQGLKYALGLGTAAVIYAAARRGGASRPAAALVLLLCDAAFTLGYSPVRAQVFTFLGLGLTLLALVEARRRASPRPLAWLVPLYALWANLHAGFLAGVGVMLLWALGRSLREGRVAWGWFLAAAACGLVSLLNPYGPAYWRYLGEAVLMPRAEIGEWRPLWEELAAGRVGGQVYYLVMVGLAGLVCWWDRSQRDWPAWLVLAATAWLGVRHLRHQVLFLLAAVALLAPAAGRFAAVVGGRLPAGRLGRVFSPPVAALALAVLLGWSLWGLAAGEPLALKLPSRPAGARLYYPLGAIRFLEARGWRGRLLPRLEWGEYVLWRLGGRVQVGMDGRYETVYPPEVIRAYSAFMYGRRGWRELLRRWPPEAVLVRPTDAPARLLAGEPGWREVYRDPGAVLWMRQRRTPPGSAAPPPPG